MAVQGDQATSSERSPTPLLDRISSPADLKTLPLSQLSALAAEIRQELIDIVTRNGGHLGASLGAIELTIALHWVFDSPRDRIVWDVGHQAYAHKLLTGRRDRFATIRQEDGLSGFLSRDESEHDAFGAGHASTSISAALGMAVAFSQSAEPDRRVAAVIGDGALTGGMAFEALNNAGILDLPFLVILNDNEMSIAPNVGAMSRYLDRVRTDPRYHRAKDELARITERLPQGELLVELGKRWKDSLKEFIYHSMIWEELGFTYMGPIDGQDLRALVEALRQATLVPGPVFLHVVTEKGRGFAGAATDRERGHAVSAPSSPGAPPSPPKYQDVFAQTVIELAKDDPDRNVARQVPGGLSGSLLRRWDSRAACGHLRRGSRRRGHAPRRRHLFDISAARLRSDHSRRLPATPAGDLRHRPRGVCRRRRPHASRRFRPDLSALLTQHDRHGAEG
jgi:1-deoxy-D-xylulose-5-phosphate synthase